MTDRSWLLYLVIQQFLTVLLFSSYNPPETLSNLLRRLCTEVTRETFCFPGPFLTCNWWWQQTTGLFLYSKLVLAVRARHKNPGSRVLSEKVGSESSPPNINDLIKNCLLKCVLWFAPGTTMSRFLLRNHFHDQIYHWRKWIQILMVDNLNTPMVNTKISSKTVVIYGIKVTIGECNLKGFIKRDVHQLQWDQDFTSGSFWSRK